MELTLPHPCPECSTSGSLTLRTVLVARPVGSSSLAGAQMKVAAREAAEVECSACGVSRRGRLEGVEVADGTIAAGHFVGREG